MPNTSRRQTL
jgi:hypothetical protein